MSAPTEENFKWFVEGILLASVGILGIFGDLLAIFVFSCKQYQRQFYTLLITLAICDLIYLVMSIMLFSLPTLFHSVTYAHWYVKLVPIMLPLAQVSLSGAIYVTIAISLERYNMVIKPFTVMSSVKKILFGYAIPICVLCLTYNLPKFFELTVEYSACNSMTEEKNMTVGQGYDSEEYLFEMECEDGVRAEIVPTPLRMNKLYIRYYMTYLNFIVHAVIPFAALFFLNISIYRKMSLFKSTEQIDEDKKASEMKLVYYNLMIVALFIFCHTVKWIPNLFEWSLTHTDEQHSIFPMVIKRVIQLSHLMLVINSASNFYIYNIKHKIFQTSSFLSYLKRSLSKRSSVKTEMEELGHLEA